MNVGLKFFLVLMLSLVVHQGATAQTIAKVQSKKSRPVPHLDRNARFRGLDSAAPIRLADYQDKVIVLALWASWCAPCQEVLYKLADLNKELATSGVVIIALSIENQQTANMEVRRFVDRLLPEYKVGWISTISADKLMNGSDAVPQIFVIRRGVVLKSFVGWDPTKTIIELRQALADAEKDAQDKVIREEP